MFSRPHWPLCCFLWGRKYQWAQSSSLNSCPFSFLLGFQSPGCTYWGNIIVSSHPTLIPPKPHPSLSSRHSLLASLWACLTSHLMSTPDLLVHLLRASGPKCVGSLVPLLPSHPQGSPWPVRVTLDLDTCPALGANLTSGQHQPPSMCLGPTGPSIYLPTKPEGLLKPKSDHATPCDLNLPGASLKLSLKLPVTSHCLPCSGHKTPFVP